MSPKRWRTVLVVVAALAAWPASGARADTRQSFDDGYPGTPSARRTGDGCVAGFPALTQDPIDAKSRWLRLAADGVVGSCGELAFPVTDPGPFAKIVARFKLRIRSNNPRELRADGLGFALLDAERYGRRGIPAGPSEPPPEGANRFEEPNFQGIGFGFDIYKNDPFDPSANHVSIHWKGARETRDVTALDLASGDWIPILVTVTPAPGQTATVVVSWERGPADLVELASTTLAGFTPFEARAYFAARSGGLTADHDVDDVDISFGNPTPPSATVALPIVPIHALMVPSVPPSGAPVVVMWDRGDVAPFEHRPFRWDPATPSAAAVPLAGTGYDLFCSGHAFLGDGRVLVAGGHIDDNVGLPYAVLFNPSSSTWERLPNMRQGRWYPTAVTTPTGDVVVLSGDISKDQVATLPEVLRWRRAEWRALDQAYRTLPLYPWAFSAPNGSVFVAGPQQRSACLDPSGRGAWTEGPLSSLDRERNYGSSVALQTDAAANELHVLIIGGGDPPVATVEEIVLGGASVCHGAAEQAPPQHAWRQLAPLPEPRRQHTALVLPDGRVAVTGGSCGAGFTNMTCSVHALDIYDPATNVWQSLPGPIEGRGYHSWSMLGADGRIIVGGGGHPSDGDSGDPDHKTIEILTPPYGGRPLDASRPRPAIGSITVDGAAAQAISYDQRFCVATGDLAAIAQVTWVRTPGVTHAFSQDLRFNRLRFQRDASACPDGVLVTPPAAPLAPPGPYMLFVLNADGVPSIGRPLLLRSRLRAPAASPDSYAAREDSALSVGAADGVLANDVDPDDVPLLAVPCEAGPISTSGGGQVTLAPDGSFQYFPASNFSGVDTFGYRAQKALGSDPMTSGCTTATITVAEANDAPSFQPGPDVAVCTTVGRFPGWARDIEGGPGKEALSTDGAALSFLITPSDPGVFEVAPAVSAADGELGFTFKSGWQGTTEVGVVLRDGPGSAAAESERHTLRIAVGPELADDLTSTEMGRPTTIDVAANDCLPWAGRPMLARDPIHGAVAFTDGASADGGVATAKAIYTPAPGFDGVDTFAYRIGGSTAAVTVLVLPRPRSGCSVAGTSSDGGGPVLVMLLFLFLFGVSRRERARPLPKGASGPQPSRNHF